MTPALRPLGLVTFLLVSLAGLVAAVGDKYLIGVGKGDITGPVVEIPLHGYAMMDQKGSGLRQRLYARSFIIADTANPADRILYIITDIMGGDTGVRNGVLDGLKALGGDYAQYTQKNVAFVGTHSHSGPGGWHNYLLHQFPSMGFNQQSYNAIVSGTLVSIKRAHQSMAEGYLDIGTTEVVDGNINRSLWAYLNNPEAERKQYGASTDTQMTLLRFKRASDGKNIGLLNWYAVHGTSAYNNNTLINGDNKGVAAWLTEQAYGDGFVAGFSQANVGDTSPNVLGQWCEDGSNAECTLEGSACADGTIVNCHGRGPAFDAGDNGLSSCYEMGRRQFAAAQTIMDALDDNWGTPVVGSTVKSFHFFKDMQWFEFPYDGTMVQTCPAALGFSFGAGTTDGPGLNDFSQGTTAGKNSANPFWKIVSGVIRSPSPEQKACQGVKPILLDVGEMPLPYPWVANIMDVQMMRVGQFVIIVAPTEATTMAGRRWRNAVKESAKTVITDVDPVVVLGGPANTYSHYTTTPEEYDIQRYEGASTLFGRYTLPAYINLTTSAIGYLAPDSVGSPPSGPTPPDNRKVALSLIPDVVYDNVPLGKKFGQVLTQPAPSYARGATVSARFQAANPRNNLRLEDTYAAVEQLVAGKWVRVRSDADWFLEFNWARKEPLLPATSEVVIKWYTKGETVAPGAYRIVYSGDSKSLLGKITAFSGTTNQFTLT